MGDRYRFYSNNNQRILEDAYRRDIGTRTFDVNTSKGDMPCGMIVKRFGGFGNVAKQSKPGMKNIKTGKYEMFRLQWDNPASFRDILPESQRSKPDETHNLILDRKLDCVQTLRYGGFACVVVEERAILKLLAREAQASITLADWQAVDAKLEECMYNARRIIPYEAQPVPEVPSSSAATQYCVVCMETKPEAAFAQLGCGHSTLCNECMITHINTQVDTMNCARITCPHYDALNSCKHHILDQEVQAILSGADYETYTTKLQRFKELMSAEVTKGDAAFEKWKKENTKPCPGCDKPIEKNQGCNHMTCAVCQCEFCWTCGGPYVAAKTPYSGPFANTRCDSSTCNYYGPAREGYCAERLVPAVATYDAYSYNSPYSYQSAYSYYSGYSS